MVSVQSSECLGSAVLLCLLQGAGVEIYPGSVCSLTGNGIHHCKDGILIKVRRLWSALTSCALLHLSLLHAFIFESIV